MAIETRAVDAKAEDLRKRRAEGDSKATEFKVEKAKQNCPSSSTDPGITTESSALWEKAEDLISRRQEPRPNRTVESDLQF
jgi:hypothetical protein